MSASPLINRKVWLDTLPKRASSAAMILEDKSGRALIVKAHYKSYWTFPGGIIDPGETPKEAALRETAEEVGIEIHTASVEFVAVIDRRSSDAQTYQFIFSAQLPAEAIDTVSLQASEINEYAFVTKAQVSQKDRHYSKALQHWADGVRGYSEQTFELNDI